MAYRTTRVVRRDGTRYPALASIAFDQTLFDLGAIEEHAVAAPTPAAPTPAAPTPPPPPPPPPPATDQPAASKPLSAMNRAQLTVEAEKSGVTIAAGMTNKQVVAAIEAARAPK